MGDTIVIIVVKKKKSTNILKLVGKSLRRKAIGHLCNIKVISSRYLFIADGKILTFPMEKARRHHLNQVLEVDVTYNKTYQHHVPLDMMHRE